MKYRYLLLDADNTLFDFNAAEHAALKKVLEKHGLPATEETIAAFHRINDGLWRRLEQGTITRDRLKIERFEGLIDYLGADYDAETLAVDYVAALGRESILLPGAESLCRTLAKDFTLSLVTNGISSVQRSRIGASPIAPYITHVFISEEIGASKPSRAFFDAVFAVIGAENEEKSLVIGDSLTSDVAGAVGYGLDVCWYTGCISEPDGTAAERYGITCTAKDYDELLSILYPKGKGENI